MTIKNSFILLLLLEYKLTIGQLKPTVSSQTFQGLLSMFQYKAALKMLTEGSPHTETWSTA